MKKLSEYECKVGVEVKGEHFERVRAALVELEACEVPLFRTQLEGGPESGPLFPIYGPTAERSERAVFYLLCDNAEPVAGLRRELSDKTRWLEEISDACLAAGIDGNLGIVDGVKGALLLAAEGSRLHPTSEWHEGIGDVLWYPVPVEEPPHCGSPLSDDWPFHADFDEETGAHLGMCKRYAGKTLMWQKLPPLAPQKGAPDV